MTKQILNESTEISQMLHDISELKKHNTELSVAGFELITAQTKLFSLLHNASDGIITFAADGKVETFNIAAQHIFGYSEAETVTRKIPDLIPCPDWVHDNVGAYIRYFIASRASEDIPLIARHRLGFDIMLHVSTGEASEQETVLFDESTNEQDPFAEDLDETEVIKKDDTIVCFFRDITLNKKLEKELEDHRHALDFAAGVITRDKDFRVIDVNNLFCQALGRNRKEFIGEKNIQSKLGGRDNFELQLQQRRDFLSQGNSWMGEACFLDKHNEKKWFNESTTPFLGEDNKPYQFLSIYTDITDRKYFEFQLRQHGDHLQDLVDEQIDDIKYARDEAERANQAKSEFLANMSHELRTPMHGIISFTHLCLKQFKTFPFDKDKSKKVQKFLSNIETSSQRLLLLLNDLLELSKLESGKADFLFEKNDLFQLSIQIQNEYTAKIDEKQLKFIIKQPKKTPIAVCDKNKILQVLSNLISNAIKFSSEKKSIQISFENTTVVLGKRATDFKQTPGLLLSVIDQGVGIPDEELDFIFNKFIQSSKTKSGAGGTGLGLSISHEIILAHKGKLWAEHNPEGGSVLKMFLPDQSAQE